MKLLILINIKFKYFNHTCSSTCCSKFEMIWSLHAWSALDTQSLKLSLLIPRLCSFCSIAWTYKRKGKYNNYTCLNEHYIENKYLKKVYELTYTITKRILGKTITYKIYWLFYSLLVYCKWNCFKNTELKNNTFMKLFLKSKLHKCIQVCKCMQNGYYSCKNNKTNLSKNIFILQNMTNAMHPY